jgi:hypothetical protein
VRSRKILIAATLVILEVGCGLPNPYYLAPPAAGNFPAGATNVCYFISPGYASGSSFVGFDVYYKFYANLPGQSDLNLGGGSVTGPFILESNGFLPMTLLTDSAPYTRTTPVIQPASGDIPNSLTVYLTFSPAAASNYYYTGGATSPTTAISIGRDLATNQLGQTGSRSFEPGVTPLSNYTSSDSDVSSVFTQCVTQAYTYILFYGLSYGVQNGTTVEYSTAVCLGYVQLTPFP